MLFLGKPYIVDARAHSDALLLFVPKEAVFGELERNPEFSRRIIAGLAARIETLVGEVDAHVRGSALDRLLDYLLRAAGARDGAVTIQLPTTKAALASRLGLTAEHFSRLLHGLARRKLIRVEGRSIVIPDIAMLAEQGRGSRARRR
jgi:CRP-like cAMP-binding protein